jgi:ribosome-interacting GTPase 1
MGILEKIQDIENEIKRTQKNKGKISRRTATAMTA